MLPDCNPEPNSALPLAVRNSRDPTQRRTVAPITPIESAGCPGPQLCKVLEDHPEQR